MLTPEQQEIIDGLCEKFKGHLSLEQIAEGIELCIANAASLYDDGLALFQVDRHARAMSLFISAMEEIGKVSVLCNMSRIPKNNQCLWADCWSDFRSHKNKSTAAFVHTYADEARQYPGLIAVATGQQAQLSPLGERLRQAGLYIDFHAKNKCWLSPNEVSCDDAELWLNRLAAALPRVQQFAALGLFSVKALKIQRNVYGPINSDRPRRKDLTPEDFKKVQSQALLAHITYYRRLVEEGVVSKEADIQVMGIPLADFISEARPQG